MTAAELESSRFRDSPPYYHRTNQYSITALTNSTGGIVERYAYDAYGGLSVFDGSGTARTSTAEGNRYTYTGREWDEELDLYHYRARMYDSIVGRFCSRDPIGYEGSRWNLFEYVSSDPLNSVDPSGLFQPPISPGQPWPIGTNPPSDSPRMVPAEPPTKKTPPPPPPKVPPKYYYGVVTCTRYPGEKDQFLCIARCKNGVEVDSGLYILVGERCRILTVLPCDQFKDLIADPFGPA